MACDHWSSPQHLFTIAYNFAIKERGAPRGQMTLRLSPKLFDLYASELQPLEREVTGPVPITDNRPRLVFKSGTVIKDDTLTHYDWHMEFER